MHHRWPGVAHVVVVLAICLSPLRSARAARLVAWGRNDLGQCNIPVAVQGGVTDVACGRDHVLAISRGRVYAWGYNGRGECNIPARVNLLPAVQVAAGDGWSMCLLTNGDLVAWGNDDDGQVSHAPSSSFSGWRKIVAGWTHGVALTGDGLVAAWGSNGQGESSVPRGLSGIIDIGAGQQWSVAVDGFGVQHRWGLAAEGNDLFPIDVTNSMTRVAVGALHGLFRVRPGGVYGWGYTAQGLGGTPYSLQRGAESITDLACGYWHNLVIESGWITAWGFNDYGECDVPPVVQGNAIRARGGDGFSVAMVDESIVSKTGRVVVWGGVWGETNVPPELRAGVSMVAAGGDHALALKRGRVFGWGRNLDGESAVPSLLADSCTWVAAGDGLSLAVRKGRVFAWGNNFFGQCNVPAFAQTNMWYASGSFTHAMAMGWGATVLWGDNTEDQLRAPTIEIGFNTTAIVAGDWVSMYLIDGKAICAGGGFHNYGRVPGPQPAPHTRHIAAGGTHCLAVADTSQDGELFAWGATGGHDVGQIAYPAAPSPVIYGYSSIAGGRYHSVAVNRGRVLAWGNPPRLENSGQTFSPAITLTNTLMVAAGTDFSMALVGAFPQPGRADYDEDAATDIAVYRPSTGTWGVRDANGQLLDGAFVTFGNPGSIPIAGDYDGDGLADYGIYEPDTGLWWVLSSATGGFVPGSLPATHTNAVPVAADYDGDGVLDMATYTPASGDWCIVRSSTDTQLGTLVLGANGIPAPGDYDGDHMDDPAVYTPADGKWRILQSSTNVVLTQTWEPGGLPAPGDFDGDGKTDLAVYRTSDGTWRIRRSSNGLMLNNAPIAFGGSGQYPVVGDYDGDGKSDLALYLPASARWRIRQSSTGLLLGGGTLTWADNTHVPAFAPYQALLALGLVPKPAASLWATTTSLGNGWVWSDWFGTLNIASEPWINHSEHGWMYEGTTAADDLWLWTSDMGWLWTSQAQYPYLYRQGDGAWLWYLEGSDNPRWFRNMQTSQWESR